MITYANSETTEHCHKTAQYLYFCSNSYSINCSFRKNKHEIACCHKWTFIMTQNYVINLNDAEKKWLVIILVD